MHVAENPAELADLIERYSETIVAALRKVEDTPLEEPTAHPAKTSPSPPSPGTASSPGWKEVGTIEGFETKWPAPDAWKAQGHDELHEHYGPMKVYEGHDENGVVRLAIGAPAERYEFYGRERGWVSVWEVANGRPVRQLANFVEVDDFEKTGERAALISGKDGAAKKGFAPNERHLLPAIYDGMRVESQRDRIVGPYSRKRLVVLARDDEIETMLDHALAHLRLRS